MNLRDAELGSTFIRKETREICILIAKSKECAFLRPKGYNGLMSYSEMFGCPNEQIHWEVVDEDKDWNLANELFCLSQCREGIIRYKQGEDINTLHWTDDVKRCRDLILKDLKTFHQLNDIQIINIINKRFGDL